MLVALRRLRWPLLAAMVSSLIVVGIAAAVDGEGLDQAPSPEQIEEACTSDNLEVPCLDGLNNSTGNNAIGVRGGHVAATGAGPGVRGFTNSSAGSAFGVIGEVNDSTPGGFSAGVRGINNGTGGLGIGGWFSQAGSGWGVLGTAVGGLGVFGSATSGTGVFGSSSSGDGVFADSSSGNGLEAHTNTGVAAVDGQFDGFSGGGFGVRGFTNSSDPNTAAVRGIAITNSGAGVGVWGSHAGTGWGVLGHSAFGTGVVGTTSTGFAGFFFGNVNVTGTLSKGAGSFKIDHPLAPAEKYLQHSFVESPEMMNVYNGNVTTDEKGFATVKMPGYFQVLNKDFRYQLTVVGRSFARAIVWKEIQGNQFVIRTDEPDVKVSWQVTGVREDAYAKANPIAVEIRKPKLEQGTYLHPELFGQPRGKSVFSAQMGGAVAKKLDAFTATPKGLSRGTPRQHQ